MNARRLLSKRIEIVPTGRIAKTVFRTGLGIGICGSIIILCVGLYGLFAYGLTEQLPQHLRQCLAVGFFMMCFGAYICIIVSFNVLCKPKKGPNP